MKICAVDLYLDLEHWRWCKNSHRGYISWTQFVENIYEFFEPKTLFWPLYQA
jgi:hypothetical protein